MTPLTFAKDPICCEIFIEGDIFAYRQEPAVVGPGDRMEGDGQSNSSPGEGKGCNKKMWPVEKFPYRSKICKLGSSKSIKSCILNMFLFHLIRLQKKHIEWHNEDHFAASSKR